jgi:hypothetical protein
MEKEIKLEGLEYHRKNVCRMQLELKELTKISDFMKAKFAQTNACLNSVYSELTLVIAS